MEADGAALAWDVIGSLLNRDDRSNAGIGRGESRFLQQSEGEGNAGFGQATWRLIFLGNSVFDVPAVDEAFRSGGVGNGNIAGARGEVFKEHPSIRDEVNLCGEIGELREGG